VPNDTVAPSGTCPKEAKGGKQFQPDNQWIGYTPAFRIHYSVQGDNAHLFFECLWVDKKVGKIAAHTNADDVLVRVNGKWLIKEMKAGTVEEL
jgi:hypothetical protein